jgi:hypothetical protein
MRHHASQTPIYRLTERLLQWSVPAVERLPKSIPYQILGSRLVSNIAEILDFIVMAYELDSNLSSYQQSRRHCYANINARIIAIKTSVRVLTAVKYTDKKHGKVPLISPKQEANFLDLVNQLAGQAMAWLR